MPSFLVWVVVALLAVLSWRIVLSKTKPRDSMPADDNDVARAAPVTAYPLLTPEMIEPQDTNITTALAKNIYRAYGTQAIGLDHEEISENLEYFVDELRQHEELLKDDVLSAHESLDDDISESKAEIARLKRRLAKAKDSEDKEELEDELAAAQEDFQMMSQGIAEPEAALAAFKADKRQFLVDYINRQFQR